MGGNLDEVSEGCLVGPFSAEEVSKALGPKWVHSRRFPVVQGAKIRPVDNFSEFGINSAFGSSEKVVMLGLDHVVGWSRQWSTLADPLGAVSVQDTAGEWHTGELHEAWKHEQWSSIRGRVADLKSAYKQLPRHPADSALSVVAVQKPGNGWVSYFRAQSLMFGETAAVYGFLRWGLQKHPSIVSDARVA